ncbi:MAG: hypothetical protein AB1659_08600 [Thermodesulfobacteriota bacterium]
MIEKLADFFRKYHFARQAYRIIKRIDFSYSIPQITPINIRKSGFDVNRINLVIPSINREHFFGGVSTALSLFNALSTGSRGSIPSRIILTDAEPDEADLDKFDGYHLVSFEDDSDEIRQIVAVNNKFQKNLFVTSGDRFLSTSWWTAYCAIQMIERQCIYYGPECNRMGYLIQDFEPGFYNWSTHYLLAESTYRSEVMTIPVFNSIFLRDYFKDQGYRFEKEFVFEPQLNPDLKRFMNSTDRNAKDQRILVYGRPSVERNCFPLIIEALKYWTTIQPDLNEWEVLSIGEAHKPIKLGNGKIMASLGKLSLEEYASLLNRSAVGLSLMVSPHPSYPPLEMAHFGILTITNSYANKNLSKCHENILSLDRLTPRHIAEALLSRTTAFSLDRHIGEKGKSMIPHYDQEPMIFPFAGELLKILFDTSISSGKPNQ